MSTRTTVSNVTFTRSFKLPSMDEVYPPGVYEIEVDEETLDTVAQLAYRRTATRIWLNKRGMTQVLEVDPKELAAALADTPEPNAPAVQSQP